MRAAAWFYGQPNDIDEIDETRGAKMASKDQASVHQAGTCRCEDRECVQGCVGADGGHCECGELDQSTYAALAVRRDITHPPYRRRSDGSLEVIPPSYRRHRP